MTGASATSTESVLDIPMSDEERDQLRRLLCLGYGIAAGTSVFAVLMPGSDRGNIGLMVLAALEVVISLVLALVPAIPVAPLKLLAFPATVVFISAAIALARPLGPTPVYYLWPALTCGHFGNRRDGLVVCVLMAIGFAAALALGNDVQVPVITYVSVMSVFLIVLGGYQRQRAGACALRRELEYAASTDGITGLLNRRAFNDAFEREVQRAVSSQLPLSVVMFDLDHFKSLNDALGHAAGDDALVAFAGIMREQCSTVTDVLARVGGEEFAVVLFGTAAPEAERVADAVAEAFTDWSRDRPSAIAVGPLTTSAGIATVSPQCQTPVELLIAADRALYAAKAAGRNRVMRAGASRASLLARVA